MEDQAVSSRSIAVIGAGYVGLITALGFASKGHSIELVETNTQRLAALRSGVAPFSETGVQDALTAALEKGTLKIFDRASGTSSETALICVGTPIDDSGHADLGSVVAALDELQSRRTPTILVVRSTMPVGSARSLILQRRISDESRFFAVPEFLRQGSALHDFQHPNRVIIGRSSVADRSAEGAMIELFGSFEAPVRLVSLEEAELIKNGSNAYLALKLSFVNELAGLSERAGADIGPVLDGISLDPRIGPAYLHPSFGFGGSCLPKELQTIAMSGMERGLEMHVTSAAAEANAAHQQLFAERISDALGGCVGRHVALLGLAFKAGTDDIRSSPAIKLGRWLLGRQAIVHAFDPAAGSLAQRDLPGLIIHDEPIDALTGADVAVIATDWPEFRDIDWARALPLMASPLVIDGRRLLDPIAMQRLGFRYQRVGSPVS